MTRRQRLARSTGQALVLLALAAPFALACSASRSGADLPDGGRASFDAGASGDSAVAAPDALAGGGADAAIDGGADEADASDPGAFAAACLDGIDQNHAGGVDCGDSSCATAPSCCIGAATMACCTRPGPTLHFDFSCATGAACDDLTAWDTFGDVGPIRVGDTFSPESDHGTDSGAILTTSLDPRAAIVELDAQLAIPSTTSEIDAIGIGLVTGGASAHVVPLAAVVASAARHEVLLLLGESVAAFAPAPSDAALHAYTLSLDPTGHVVATVDGTHLEADVPLPSGPVQAAFFGRATNPGSTTTEGPARIGSLDVAVHGCDQPAALTRLGAVTIVDHTSAVILSTATDPNVVVDGSARFIAFTAASMAGAGSGIFVGAMEADGAFHVRAPSGGTQPVLSPAAGESYESPALATNAGVWSLYATRVHADGSRSLVASESTSSDVLTLQAAHDLVLPDLAGDVGSPATIPGDPTHLVARHQATGEAAELVLLTLGGDGLSASPMAGICGADSACSDGARTQAHLYAARTGTIVFDADDVDDPAVVFYDHVYRLYYAGRLGSRWSIGMLVAADLGYWRASNGGSAILAADGSGFDAVSVRGPSPLTDTTQLTLYYVGADGDATTIALADGGAITP